MSTPSFPIPSIGTTISDLKAHRGISPGAVYRLRQREINENVVGWMIEPNTILKGQTVVDFCAGAEGSLFPVHSRGGRWVGNEIAPLDYKTLESTVTALNTGRHKALNEDAYSLSLPNNYADFSLFIMALCHLRMQDAIIEAKRLTKPGGRIIVATPGPTYWLTNIITYTCLEHLLTSSPRKKTNAQNFELWRDFLHKSSLWGKIKRFEESTLKPIEVNLHMYSDFLLFNMFGLAGVGEFSSIMRKGLNFKGSPNSKFLKRESNALNELHWKFLWDTLMRQRLDVSRMGIMKATGPVDEDTGWAVGPIIDCEASQENLSTTNAERITETGKLRSAQTRSKETLYIRALIARKPSKKEGK